MAESIGPIASAVIIPEPETKSPRIKRRNSPSVDHASKRPRLSHDGTTILLHPAVESEGNPEIKDVQRKNSVQEERQRGQRLFGGLLNTLSQSTPNGQQKRRLEIERKQQERVRLQKVEDEVRLKERLDGLKAIRKAEQIKFDEEAMRTRHENALAMANFLTTEALPKLYYKPWQLLPEQENRIKVQLGSTEEQIDREEEDFYMRHPERERPSRINISKDTETNDVPQETVGEPHESPSISNEPVPVNTTNPTTQAHQVERDAGGKGLEEQNGEVVDENEEDTVIY